MVSGLVFNIVRYLLHLDFKVDNFVRQVVMASVDVRVLKLNEDEYSVSSSSEDCMKLPQRYGRLGDHSYYPHTVFNGESHEFMRHSKYRASTFSICKYDYIYPPARANTATALKL
jgi:hypothetical protein